MRDKIGELVTAYDEKRDAALKKQLTVDRSVRSTPH